MNNIVFLLLREMPLIVLSLLFLIISVVLYIAFYVYMNIYIKNISKIIFNDENKYRRPLEPFSFIVLSYLPTTFWREILNIKYGKSFKKLYGKEFYHSINRNQLIELMKNYKAYFLFQYIIFFLVAFALIFMTVAYILDKYF